MAGALSGGPDLDDRCGLNAIRDSRIAFPIGTSPQKGGEAITWEGAADVFKRVARSIVAPKACIRAFDESLSERGSIELKKLAGKGADLYTGA